MTPDAVRPAVATPAAEAARYALLRRLAPSMRHHLVVNLQPIGMVHEIMDRRLRAPEPNLADVHDGVHKINSYARAALASCLDVVTWLAPEGAARTTAAQGVSECLSLVQTGFTFRGFALRDEVEPVAGEVGRAAFRHVISATLLHVTDENAPPAQIAISARGEAGALVVTVAWTPTEGEQGFATAPTYRPITWDDVQALAAADAVQVAREGDSIRVSLPWALASA
ncbi:MAG TPA: hypothetical protein VM489_00170 [Burkholderiales bacterium]|nr:hypothetical protein [Burkholderiales bacterium]